MLLSPSSVNMYQTCPYSYYLSHVKGIKLTNGYALEGRCVHRVLERFWAIYEDLKDVDKAIQASIDENWDIEVNEERANVISTMLDNFVQIVKKDSTRPLFLEKEIVDEELGLKCVLDRVDEKRIVDYKTGSAVSKPKDVVQSTLYHLVLKKNVGLDLPVEFLYLQKNKVYRYDVTEKIIEQVMGTVERVRDSILKEEFPKNEKGCFMCDYKVVCKLIGQKQSPIGLCTKKEYLEEI